MLKLFRAVFSGIFAAKFTFIHYRHNEDGSYTYGYEGSDGSFKLETRYSKMMFLGLNQVHY
jgi:hypothetical protein